MGGEAHVLWSRRPDNDGGNFLFRVMTSLLRECAATSLIRIRHIMEYLLAMFDVTVKNDQLN